MPDVFISYAREDQIFVERLRAALRNHDREVWLDRASELGAGIEPATEWKASTVDGIDRSDAFVFVLSGHSLASTPCRDELAHAAQVNKRLIPVCLEEPAHLFKVPEPIRDLSWIMLRRQDDFERGVAQLIRALDVDLDAVRTHTRILVRAMAWDAADRRASPLLRGEELRKAEEWLSRASSVGAPPTDLHREFIVASRHQATRRQRLAVGASVAVALVAVALSIFALIQRHNAIVQGDRAQSELLASKALDARGSDLQLASLYALEAYRLSPTFEARSAIMSVADTPELGSPLLGHTGYVSSVALSPDGRMLASASADHTVRLWDVRSHREVGAPLLGHTAAVNAVAFSPDGRILASASTDDLTARLWDVRTHKQLGAPLMHMTTSYDWSVNAVAFSPNGRILATGGSDKLVRLWDVRSHRELGNPLAGATDSVECLVFSPDGRTIASGNDDSTARLWNVATHRALGAPLKSDGGVKTVAFSSDGSMLATGGTGAGLADVSLWDVRTHRRVAALHGHTDTITGLAFSPDGRTLISGSQDKTLRFWDVRTHRALGAPIAGSSPILGVALSGDGRTVATADYDATIRLWGRQSDRELGPPIRDVSGSLRGGAFGPDGRTIGAASANGAMLWDLWTHRQIGIPLGATLPSKHRPMTLVTFSPDGHTLATSGLDGFVRLWDLRTHQNEISFSGPAAPPYDLAFSPDGRRLVAALSGVPNAPPVLFDAHTYRVLDQFKPLDVSDAINDASFSPDGRWLAFSHATGVVRLRNVLNSRQGPTISLPGFRQAVGLVRFSPDGRTLALASEDKTVRFVDVQDRSQIGDPLNTGSFINWIAFSPDGRELATADGDDTLRIWDTQTHRELGTPLTGSGPVTNVEFSPDSHTIMTTDGTVRLWSNYPLHDYIRQICSYIDPRHAKQIWTNTEPTVQYQPPC